VSNKNAIEEINDVECFTVINEKVFFNPTVSHFQTLNTFTPSLISFCGTPVPIIPRLISDSNTSSFAVIEKSVVPPLDHNIKDMKSRTELADLAKTK
jgi:hypothetical protein